MLPYIIANNLHEVKAIVKSFEGPGVLVTQTNASLQTNGLATGTQLLKIKDKYECLAKLIETMESTKYTIKEAMQVMQDLEF